MSKALYFKDLDAKDVLYKAEDGKLILEVIDRVNPIGNPVYFGSLSKRDNYILRKKERLLRINEDQANKIIASWA